MEPEKRPVRLIIFGQAYTVLADDQQHVEALAKRVDDLMHSIANHGSHDIGRTAVLACLHLADELANLEQDMEDLKSIVDSKSRKFSDLLSQAME